MRRSKNSRVLNPETASNIPTPLQTMISRVTTKRKGEYEVVLSSGGLYRKVDWRTGRLFVFVKTELFELKIVDVG